MNGGKLSRETEMVKLTSSFKLEYELIDRDHRRLIEIINDVKQVIEDGKPEECETLVPDFVNLAKKHFQSEEAFLKKIGYPTGDLVPDFVNLAKNHCSFSVRLNRSATPLVWGSATKAF